MNKLWGTRFRGDLSELAKKFTFSIDYDSKLALYDCRGSIAHAEMLGSQGILTKKDASAITGGLKKILSEIQKGVYKHDPASEDIHTDIQNRLKKLIGKPADRLHTARSRNDQVVTDLRLYCMDHIKLMCGLIEGLQKSILTFADANHDVIMPAYTHLQAAQVVLMSHHMLAYVEMLERDKARFQDAYQRVAVNTLGSCALAGSTLPTDREVVTKKLGFLSTSANSMDSVADRDFVLEVLSDISITGMHLSRLCEDLILWVTDEFGFISIEDAFCTGSSIMPHKRNPDVLELIRGASARFPARLMEISLLLKGLPLTYNRDLQLDKPALFCSVGSLEDMLKLMSEMFKGITVNRERIAERVQDEHFFSVDVLEYLVKKGATYRDAHDTVGLMVREGLDRGKKISQFTQEQLKHYSPYFEDDVKYLLTPEVSVKSKKSYGSTNPVLVRVQLNKWKKRLK
jgi:argininosuccinate lyase